MNSLPILELDDRGLSWIRLAVVLSLLAIVGCSGEQEGATLCVAERENQVVVGERDLLVLNGADSENYLRAGNLVTRGIGSYRSANVATGPLCTAVMIAGGAALSARHCLEIEDPEISLADGTVLQVKRSVPHPVLDIALHELSVPCEIGSLFEFPLAHTAERAWELGQRVVMAGVGLNEAERVDQLKFAVSTIVDTTSNTIVVSSNGQSGACLGDSGGPLFARSSHQNGDIVLLGILSSGSASCLGRDDYIRTDTIASWLGQELSKLTLENANSSGSCGDLDSIGACFDGAAIWCASEVLHSEQCSGTLTCGWSPDDGGYRCVEPGICDGDARGACTNRGVAGCNAGIPISARCEATCGVDPQTGQAICLEPIE